MSLVRQSDPETEIPFTTSLRGSGRNHVSPVAPLESEDSPIGTIRPFAHRTGRTVTNGAPGTDLPSRADVPALASRFETAPAEEVVAWALNLFGPGLALVCSFQNCVLIDLATKFDAEVEVVFLDTGSHFAETLTFVEEVRALYDLNLRVMSPGADVEEWRCGSERCCELRKLAPLTGALAGRDAWMTGLKRVDTPNRANSPVAGWDSARGLIKINPLARWSHHDVARYEADHQLPVHPLRKEGYLSIGCSPTTRPVSPLEDPRAGRWPGTSKTECGLHTA